MKFLKLTFALSMMIAFTSQSIAGGGWVHAKGRGYFKLSQWWVIADKHYSDNGGIDDDGVTRGTFNTSLYGEYGITDRLNAQLYFPFFSRSFNNEVVSLGTGQVDIEGRSVNSIGDADIGLKYGLVIGKPVVLSAHFWLGLPLGKSDYDVESDEVPLLTGDGEFNQIVGLTASTSKTVGSVNAFVSLGAEFNNRTNGFSDETRVNFELGAVIKEKLILVYKFRWLNSLQNGDSTVENGASIFSNNAEYLGYTYEIAYNITKQFGATFNYGAVYSAKLIFANPSYEVGVYFNL